MPIYVVTPLKVAGVENWFQLAAKTPSELLALPQFGPKCLRIVRRTLTDMGLELKHDQTGFEETLVSKFKIVATMIEQNMLEQANALAAKAYPELLAKMKAAGHDVPSLPVTDHQSGISKYIFELVGRGGWGGMGDARRRIREWFANAEGPLVIQLPKWVELKVTHAGGPAVLPEVKVVHVDAIDASKLPPELKEVVDMLDVAARLAAGTFRGARVAFAIRKAAEKLAEILRKHTKSERRRPPVGLLGGGV
jgi:hypothetical protein